MMILEILIKLNLIQKLIFTLLHKQAVLHTTTLTHCKATQVLRDLFSTDQENGT